MGKVVLISLDIGSDHLLAAIHKPILNNNFAKSFKTHWCPPPSMKWSTKRSSLHIEANWWDRWYQANHNWNTVLSCPSKRITLNQFTLLQPTERNRTSRIESSSIHYTHENRFRSMKRDIHEVFREAFSALKIEGLRLIVGHHNSPSLQYE